jgi:D-arabinose 1-dehydrogenase-like Zn-dependent alcohol dehydrogenase
MLVPHGTLILLGVPEEKMSLSAFEFVGQHRSITGSLIGSIGDIKSMLNFASKHGVKPWIVVKKMSEVNEGIAMVRTNQVKYRVVLKN